MPQVTVEHVLQPAILCRDIDATMDLLHTLLGIYPSERVDITNTGVNNAVYAFADQTYLELIEPYDPDASAMRLLDRHGEGWHMVAVDLAPMPVEEVARDLADAGVRVVRENATKHVEHIWHLHPRDTCGVLLAMALRVDRDDNGAWAGWAWREYVETNTRVVRSILGVSLATDDPDGMIERYTRLGFTFGEAWDDAGDTVRQATMPRGTFLQVRTPATRAAPSAAWVAQRGSGLFHMTLAAPDLDKALDACRRAGVTVARRADIGDGGAFWTEPTPALGVPLEFRRVASERDG